MSQRPNHLEAIFIPSENFDTRPIGHAISLIVIHCISIPEGVYGGSEIIDLFTNQINFHEYKELKHSPGIKVSSHFLIRRDGKLFQFVDCENRAWHAGNSSWQGKPNCNDYSIGIELEGTDKTTFSESQYMVLSSLTKKLCQKYPIRNIVGHKTIAPNRKTDPGKRFAWNKFYSLLAKKNSFPTR